MQARYIYGMHVHTIHTQNQELSQLIEFKRFQQMIDDFKLHEQGYKQFHAILLQSQNLSSFLAKNYPEYSAEFNKIWNLHYKNLRKNSPNVALFGADEVSQKMNFFAAEIARKIGYKYTNFAEEYQKFYGESLEKHQEKLSPSDCKKLQEYLMGILSDSHPTRSLLDCGRYMQHLGNPRYIKLFLGNPNEQVLLHHAVTVVPKPFTGSIYTTGILEAHVRNEIENARN